MCVLVTNIENSANVVAAPTLWNTLPSSVKSVENIAKFRCHLKTCLYNVVCTSQFNGVSMNMLTTGIVY